MPQHLADLVGRAMIDPEFLADLQRAPETVLAQYELTPDERKAVQEALSKLADSTSTQRMAALRTVLLRRVAT